MNIIKLRTDNNRLLGYVSRVEKTFVDTLGQDCIITPSIFRSWDKYDGLDTFLLVDKGNIISTATIFNDNGCFEISTIYTEPEFRNKGLTKKFLSSLFEKLELRNLKSNIAENNKSSLGLFISLGFKFSGERSNYSNGVIGLGLTKNDLK